MGVSAVVPSLAVVLLWEVTWRPVAQVSQPVFIFVRSVGATGSGRRAAGEEGSVCLCGCDRATAQNGACWGPDTAAGHVQEGCSPPARLHTVSERHLWVQYF